jgi:molybdate transport system ATP-binding protein
MCPGNSTILRIENLHVTLSGKNIIRDVSLEIKKGEQWAIYGEYGSGKTVLAHTLAGHHHYSGFIEFPEVISSDWSNSVWVVDLQHRFKDLQNQTNFYYQQRYNAFDSEATRTLADELAGFQDDNNGNLTKKNLLAIFQLNELLDEPLVQLSNGENKRLQLLKAILNRHRLLILDEPFTGLDNAGRKIVNEILTTVSEAGQAILLFTSRNYFPDCFNRFSYLQQGRLFLKEIPADQVEKNEIPSHVRPRELPLGVNPDFPDFEFAVRMHEVNVQYGEKHILKNINWTVEKSACWSLTGPNGAGKSTLLSLITADNPQAYANDIVLFDRKRGSGESIWEIKQKIGFLSPELHLYFDPAATAFTALASGFFDTIGLFRRLNPHQESKVWEWLQFLECAEHAHLLLSGLPASLQRLILLARSMIKSPPLLILDEPCQGLDALQTGFTLGLVDQYCRQNGAGLIFVSHYSSEFPSCISCNLRLEKGRIV